MIENQGKNISISLQDFLRVPTDRMNISVSKFISNFLSKTLYECLLVLDFEEGNILLECMIKKRYTEFQGFYDSLTYRYQNLKFPSFPSKFQIRKKEEFRKNFFDSLLKSVIKLAEAHPEIKKELLKLLYEFMFGAGVEVKTPSPEIIKQIRDLALENSLLNRKSSLCSNEKSYEDNSLRVSLNTINLKQSNSGITDSNMLAKIFQKEEITSKDCWQIEFKLSNKKFNKAYMKITDQFLFLYDSIVANNFFYCLPLYKIQWDIFKISDNKKVYLETQELLETASFLDSNNVKEFSLSQMSSELHFHLYHSYDNSSLIIRLDSKNHTFSNLIDFLSNLETNSNLIKSQSKFMGLIDETNQNIYGKLSLYIEEIKIPQYDGNILANIFLNPYILKTKSVISKENFTIKQTFSIPIHNRFEILKIEIINQTHQGLFQKKIVDEKLGEYFVYIPDVLNNYYPDKIYDVSLDSSIINKSTKQPYKISFSFKICNFSSVLALVTKNRNKNVLEDTTLSKSDEDISIKNLMKRLKKIIYIMKEFKDYYKTLFRFKYPVYSSIVCILLLIYFMVCDMNYFVSHILILVAYIIFAHSQFFQTYLYPYADKYIFKIKNSYDFESVVVTKVELEGDELKKDDYLTHQETKKNIIKAIIEPIKNFKTYKNTYHQVLFNLTSFVAILEKIKNLFLWTDPLLSFYFCLILVTLFMLLYAIPIRFLMIFAVLNKFINGMRFFKKKYINNMEIADIVLKHCHFEHFNETKNKIKHFQQIEDKPQEKSIDTISIYDDKFRIFIKEQLEKHVDIVIKMEFLNSVNKLSEIKDAISKSKIILKIKKESPLYKLTKNNSKIYKTPIDIELIFLYFVQNIKSDYYLSKYYSSKAEQQDSNCNYSSVSNTDIKEVNESQVKI